MISKQINFLNSERVRDSRQLIFIVVANEIFFVGLFNRKENQFDSLKFSANENSIDDSLQNFSLFNLEGGKLFLDVYVRLSSMTNFDFLRQVEAAVLASVSTDHLRRQQAFTYLEQIKSNPTQSISIGFQFFDPTQQFDPFAKHFGLQCIEETIKYKWTSLDGPLKLSIKERLWCLMTEQFQLPGHLRTLVISKLSFF